MLCKKLACVLSLTAAFAFVACDDESSALAPRTDGDDTQLSSDSKGNDKSSESKVEETSSESKDDGKSSESKDNATSSSSIGGGSIDIDDFKCDDEGAQKTETYLGQEIVLVCEKGYWTYDEEAMEELESCDTEGATMSTEILGMPVYYVCTDGAWEVDSAATSKCDKEGDEMEIDMGGIVMKATCIDGTWVPDEEAMDDQFKCTEAEEGTTKEMMGMPFVCTDGEWTPDFGDIDFGGGDVTLD